MEGRAAREALTSDVEKSVVGAKSSAESHNGNDFAATITSVRLQMTNAVESGLMLVTLRSTPLQEAVTELLITSDVSFRLGSIAYLTARHAVTSYIVRNT